MNADSDCEMHPPPHYFSLFLSALLKNKDHFLNSEASPTWPYLYPSHEHNTLIS